MKKLMMAAAVILLAACENVNLNDAIDEPGATGAEAVKAGPHKNFKFTVKGDFGAATFTKGYLSADGQEMTDVWAFDYVDGALVQQAHQTPADAAWGTISMPLSYGNHHVYFVASRGTTPSVDTDGGTISWGTTKDTFWKDYEVSVVSTSNGNRAVTLDRVATKLRVTITDEVPEGCSQLIVRPARWYRGLNYKTGAAVTEVDEDRSVTVPAEYAGTAGQLAINVFGLSGADEWTTTVSVTAKDVDGNVIGSAQSPGVPFRRNRATNLAGNLFASSGGIGVGINADWLDPVVMEW